MTEWVCVCGHGTGRCVIIEQVPVPAMKTWAKGAYMGQEFAVNNIVSFLWLFAIHDDKGAGSRAMLCDPEIVKSQNTMKLDMNQTKAMLDIQALLSDSITC